jgi:hypothetical protein
VIRETIRSLDKVALARVVLTNREHVIALEARDNGLMGMLLRYPYEVRPVSEYFDDIQDVKITRDMLDLAKHIVEQKSGHFAPEKFEDHYETALQDLLQKKQNGQPIAKVASRTSGNVIDIMDALRASLQDSKVSAPSAKPAAKRAKPPEESDQGESYRPAQGRLGPRPETHRRGHSQRLPRLFGIEGSCGRFTVIDRMSLRVEWTHSNAVMFLHANLKDAPCPAEVSPAGRTIWTTHPNTRSRLNSWHVIYTIETVSLRRRGGSTTDDVSRNSDFWWAAVERRLPRGIAPMQSSHMRGNPCITMSKNLCSQSALMNPT